VNTRIKKHADPALVAGVIAKLSARFGARLSTGQAVREQHGRGEAMDPVLPPDAVVGPETTAEISDIITLCAAASVPVIAFGAGTSLEGSGVPAPRLRRARPAPRDGEL
jgi:D-lactate dehydrogenase (cytochrome)